VLDGLVTEKEGAGLTLPALKRQGGAAKAATAISPPFTQSGPERANRLLVRSRVGKRMSERDNKSDLEEHKRATQTERLDRVVELARRVLRERGLTDQQIDVLLKRPRAPEDLR
jgi:hypothetical protein